jgi:membrane-bound lytic murein transglycosylase B
MPLRHSDRAKTLPTLLAAAALLLTAILPAVQAAAETEPPQPAKEPAGEPAVQQPAAPMASDPAFTAWKEALRQEALGLGISKETLDKALTPAVPIAKVIELDRKQPEFTQTFWRYVDLRVNDARIARGQEMLKAHAALLDRIWRKYHVPPRFLVAFWGLESNYGDHFGGYPVIDALVTLAYDQRRSKFFREQLIDALKIVNEGDISVDRMRGSWAGAMGHLQFIPSTFVRYAVDEDGDGRRDIWGSLPDTFASAANYLSSIGWRGDETWGREVKLPARFDYELSASNVEKSLNEWARLGVTRPNGQALPQADIKASLVLPAGHQGPAFLTYANYQRILNWNRSALYAISVGHLADRLIGKGPLLGARPATEQPLSRAMVIEMQERLGAQGYDAGSNDGVIGPLTRTAIRAYQKARGLPPDGFPTVELLEKLRGG